MAGGIFWFVIGEIQLNV